MTDREIARECWDILTEAFLNTKPAETPEYAEFRKKYLRLDARVRAAGYHNRTTK